MLNQKELTQSVFDLFEKVRRQAAMYDEAFKKLEYNSSVFNKLVDELAKIDETINADKDQAISDIQAKLEKAVFSIDTEKKNLLKELSGVENLHQLTETYNKTIDKHQKGLDKAKQSFDNIIKDVEKLRNNTKRLVSEITEIKSGFNEQLKIVKSSADDMLKKQLEKLKIAFSETIHDEYRELEIYINNRQSIFEKKSLQYYEKLEVDFINFQKKLNSGYANVESRLNIVDNLVTNKITADDSLKSEVFSALKTMKNDMGQYNKTFKQVNDIGLDKLGEITEQYENSSFAKKNDIRRIVAEENVKLQNDVDRMNKKNNIALTFSILCLLATIVLIVLST